MEYHGLPYIILDIDIQKRCGKFLVAAFWKQPAVFLARRAADGLAGCAGIGDFGIRHPKE